MSPIVEVTFLVGASLQLYLLLWFIAARSMLFSVGASPSMFALFMVLREARGVMLRAAYRLPSYSSYDSFSHALGPDWQTATRQELIAARDQILQRMSRHPGAYPWSQREAVTVAAQRLWSRIQQVQRGNAARKQHAQQEASRAAVRRPSGWRAVLGLPRSECDVAVIKRAYRKLASTAHPDRGGSNEQMSRLNKAMQQARDELSFS